MRTGGFAGQALIPVVVIDDPRQAPGVVIALAAGGIRCAEITLRTPAAPEALAAAADAAARTDTGFVVGAGTVLTTHQLTDALAAGAQFAVSPGLDADLVAHAREAGLDYLPGVATGSEVQLAARMGLSTLKFFPADRLGGIRTIAALAAPFPDIGFVPSGGVSLENMDEYLRHPAVTAISGSWMVSRALVARGDFAEIERLSREARGRADAVAREELP